jgi:hypothetical protein
MAKTFFETMNTVAFRAVAGWARREADLWPLRDLLLELQQDVQRIGETSYLKLKEGGLDDVAEGSAANTRLFAALLEKDIQTIEAYCAANDIAR